MNRFVLIFVFLLSACGTTVQKPDESLIPTKEVTVSPEALQECKKYSKLPVKDMPEDEVVEYINGLYNINDECSDKQKILSDFIKGLNLKNRK